MHADGTTDALLVGVNIGGTSTTIVAGTIDGTIVSSERIDTNATETAESFFTRIRVVLDPLAPMARAIGVAVGGPLDAHRGVVLAAPHLPHLANFPLRGRLLAAYGRPVKVHHDAAACALAEFRWGPNTGAHAIAYLTCGTGFGAGLVFDGVARYGSGGLSPEIGHVRFRDVGPDIFGKPGCYEGYGAANSIAMLAREYDPIGFRDSTPAQISTAAAAGDERARAALRDNIEAVGSACALLADLLVVDVISLGSLAAYLGEPWIAAVRAVFIREALPKNVESCALRAAMPDVQDLSALAAAADACD